GVTGPQRLVVRVVSRYPGASAGHLANVLHLHPSTLTGVLHRLETGRIIERKLDPKDGRRALFHLTHRGQEIARSSAGTVESIVKGSLARIPHAKVAVAKEVLATLAEELQRRGSD